MTNLKYEEVKNWEAVKDVIKSNEYELKVGSWSSTTKRDELIKETEHLKELLKRHEKENKKMTYTKLLEWAEENTNMNLADVALAEMMDIVEEETGVYPNWNDKVPQWILNNFGY